MYVTHVSGGSGSVNQLFRDFSGFCRVHGAVDVQALVVRWMVSSVGLFLN